jgi:CheY-like chemotaxis protein
MDKRILVIEDNRLNREMVKASLEQEGFQVSVASTGEEGLEKLKNEKIDLVILDLILPGLDGFGVISIIKSDPQTKQIPIVVFTVRDSKQEMDEVKRLGAEYCYVKYKVKPTDLVKILRGILT